MTAPAFMATWIGLHGLLLGLVVARRVFGRVTGV